MSGDLKTEVESWLDANWDSENQREIGTESYDGKRWLTKVVDAGYALLFIDLQAGKYFVLSVSISPA